MYKLLLVDDEDIERESMAQLIAWESCGMKLMDTAWNGVEGYEKVKLLTPDVVITDIKMPVMDGIEFIRRSQEMLPDTIFVVLSGYGEFEYTSKAMELGVRHYILKPCDEEKIVDILKKVFMELERRRGEREEENRFRTQVRRLLPRAKEQIFRNMLLNREQVREDYTIFAEEIGENSKVGLLAFRSEKPLDYLEQFALSNILMELFGQEHVLLNTMIEKDVLFLLHADVLKDQLESLISKVKREFLIFDETPLKAAVSKSSSLRKVSALYEETLQLLVKQSDGEQTEKKEYPFDYEKLNEAKAFSDILFECYLASVKMEMEQYGALEKKAAYEQCLSVLCGEASQLKDYQKEWDMLVFTVSEIFKRQGKLSVAYEEEVRMRNVLILIYQNIRSPKLSIQYLAKEALFMNEDYLGRLFKKNMKEKYSDFILRIRILLACRILYYRPEMRISQLAEQVGYPPDGQYFAKAMKKICGVSPSEYRKSVKNRKNEK